MLGSDRSGTAARKVKGPVRLIVGGSGAEAWMLDGWGSAIVYWNWLAGNLITLLGWSALKDQLNPTKADGVLDAPSAFAVLLEDEASSIWLSKASADVYWRRPPRNWTTSAGRFPLKDQLNPSKVTGTSGVPSIFSVLLNDKTVGIQSSMAVSFDCGALCSMIAG